MIEKPTVPYLPIAVAMKATATLTPAEQLAKARHELLMNEKTQAKWRKRFRGAQSEKAKSYYSDKLAAAVRNGEKLAMKIERLEQQQGGEQAAPAPRVWHAKRTFTCGTRHIAPNDEISEAELSTMLNREQLIRREYVMPGPSLVRPERPAPVAPAPKPSVPAPSPITTYAGELLKLSRARNVDLFDVEDCCIAAGVRAQKEFVEEPAMRMSQAWGGGNQMTKTGIGSSRRIFDVAAFRARVRAEAEQLKQQETAT
jgi:hypothetical protein